MSKLKLIKANVMWISESSGDACILVNKKAYYTNLCSFKTLEDQRCVAWHMHDVFKNNIENLKEVYIDANSNYLDVYVETKKLYSITKLRKLSKSKSFKSQDFSFFDYGYVMQLLGTKKSKKAMSGLFK